MSKVLTVMGLNWLYWRDLVAGIMVPRRHLAVKPGTNWRNKQLQTAKRIIPASFQDRNVPFLTSLTRLFYVWC